MKFLNLIRKKKWMNLNQISLILKINNKIILRKMKSKENKKRMKKMMEYII